MANMLAYPGRTFGQLYHAFFRVNGLADGRIELGSAKVNIRKVTQPVLSVAGNADILAPKPGQCTTWAACCRRRRRSASRGHRRPSRSADGPLGDEDHLGLPRRLPREARPAAGGEAAGEGHHERSGQARGEDRRLGRGSSENVQLMERVVELWNAGDRDQVFAALQAAGLNA